jgi:hypothetical protein
LFQSDFWADAWRFMPDIDVVMLFLGCSILISSVLFFLCNLLFSDNIFALLGLFFAIIIVGSFICYELLCREMIPTSNSIDLDVCKRCVTQLDNDTFFLAQYDLIKAKSADKKDLFEQYTLQSIEESLGDGDEVIIYTSLQASELDVVETVKANVARGVKYSVIYYREMLFSPEEIGLYSSMIKVGESTDSIDYHLAQHNSGFDLFCYKRKNSGKIESYFAVNYSVRDEGDNICWNAANGYCLPENQCHVDNENLFYKKLDNSIAMALYAKLSGIISRAQRRGNV